MEWINEWATIHSWVLTQEVHALYFSHGPPAMSRVQTWPFLGEAGHCSRLREWKFPRSNKKALMRRWVSILQGARGPDWFKYEHYKHSASSLPPEGMHLVWKEEGSKDNRAFWSISGTQKRALASEPRSTAKMKCKRQVRPYLKYSLLTSASWEYPLRDKSKEALLTQSLQNGGQGGRSVAMAMEQLLRNKFCYDSYSCWDTGDSLVLASSDPCWWTIFICPIGEALSKNVNIQCWEGVRRWVYNTGKNINLSEKQFETTHQKSQKWPCPYRFILKK